MADGGFLTNLIAVLGLNGIIYSTELFSRCVSFSFELEFLQMLATKPVSSEKPFLY